MRAPKRLATIWRRRQLLLELVHKDFDARYAGSVLGIVWTQLYPLLLLGVYTFVFSVIFKNDIPRFPLFLFVGIVIWTFVSSSFTLSTSSILVNSNLVLKVGFPRELLALSAVIIPLLDLAASHVILVGGALIFGVAPSTSWLALPLVVLLLALGCAGAGLVLATAAVYLRDVRWFVDVGVLLLMFLSPVFYSAASVPASFAWVVQLNPIAVAITAYRGAFLDGVWPSPLAWASLSLAAAFALWVGIELFDRGQRGFPDAL